MKYNYIKIHLLPPTPPYPTQHVFSPLHVLVLSIYTWGWGHALEDEKPTISSERIIPHRPEAVHSQ